MEANKVSVEVNIWELQVLIGENQKMADAIPKEAYDRMTMAGHTLGVTAKKYYDRARELDNLLQRTWPK
jgi:hypothetical protein